MDNDDLMFMVIIGGGVIAAAIALFVFVSPYLSGEAGAEKRMTAVAASKPRASKARTAVDVTQNRKNKVAETLQAIEDQQKARDRPTLRTRLLRAGLDVSPNAFWVASVICGVVVGVVTYFGAPNMPIALPIAAGFIGVLGLPRWILNKMISRRQNKFLAEFANAIDVIVRGVKSGLPLSECLNIIARESPDPVGPEFKTVVEESRLGVPLGEAFERLMARVPLAETRFFAIVIGIQQSAGGNLSEALGNLSGVLRDRRTMQMKVKALSAEARASAMVLGSLPFIVMTLIYVTTPAYIMFLFTRTFGHFLLAGAAFWMTCGLLIMRKMINFKF